MHYIIPFNIPKMMSHSLSSSNSKNLKTQFLKNVERENYNSFVILFFMTEKDDEGRTDIH